MENRLEEISDRITAAHATVQATYQQINPVVGVNRQMRKAGVPADSITIDCLRTDKRILLVLHDENPDQIYYQFGIRTEDPGKEFQMIPSAELTEQQLVDWIVEEFS